MDPSIPHNNIEEYNLQKKILTLATVVATVTYAAGFNPPGGSWQAGDKVVYLSDGDGKGYLAGEPIMRTIHYHRFLVFFYCNAAAFASSIVVALLVLAFAIRRGTEIPLSVSPVRRNRLWKHMLTLAMALGLLGLVGAYAAGTSQDKVTSRIEWVPVAVSFILVVIHMVSWYYQGNSSGVRAHENTQTSSATVDTQTSSATVPDKWQCGALMLLATFITSTAYTSGLSTPGGFWGSSQDGHLAGDLVLQERHSSRLQAFLFCNTTAFVMSLLVIVLLMEMEMNRITFLHRKVVYPCTAIALLGLGGAYAVGSCREADNTVYVATPLLAAAFLVCILLLVIGFHRWQPDIRRGGTIKLGATSQEAQPMGSRSEGGQSAVAQGDQESNSGTRFKVPYNSAVLLANLMATVTYQAGLVPPGGVWQDNQDGHKAGDPILLSTNSNRYKVFFYCNSTAFVASLAVIISVQFQSMLNRNVLEVTIILGLFGLTGAYASGSCRDVGTSIYLIALAGAIAVYVLMHLAFFKHSRASDDTVVHRRSKMLLLLAVLATTLTYQAGLTPPSGFQQFGDQAGGPVLLHNYPRRYKTFFYCNSVSFMSSVTLIILLGNQNLYRIAIQSYALSVCAGVGLFTLVGAYAAGSTQHLDTSIYILVLVAVVLLCTVILLVVVYCIGSDDNQGSRRATMQQRTPEEAMRHNMSKYLVMLGVLAASATYQAGLNPPGGVWQDNSGGHAAGDPVMQDNRRHRYTAFFYSNSTSFMASVAIITMLLPKSLHRKRWLNAMNIIMMLNLLGLLGAYAAGSTTEWETAGHVIALLVPALVCAAIQALLLKKESPAPAQSQETEAPGSPLVPAR